MASRGFTSITNINSNILYKYLKKIWTYIHINVKRMSIAFTRYDNCYSTVNNEAGASKNSIFDQST